MTTLGFLVAIGPWIIGVPLPVALRVLAGILTFVPYIAAFVSAIPSLLLAASVNLKLAIYVVLLYLAVHLIDGYILVPLVQRRVLHLLPGLTLSAPIVLGVLAEFLGLVLATPLVAAARGWSISNTCSVIARQPNPPRSTIRPIAVPGQRRAGGPAD